ncbi:hypothetical protein PRZ48_003611 [Zasmidium cellare]|uniref:Uncharacterized protein n=1 Tax=Zasmidium cellare TaxID=395010 RepID=A0ABR0EWT1_ZASCE|nr:hypothetical protein PRZ48_003611 [Zasmidium cellare]
MTPDNIQSLRRLSKNGKDNIRRRIANALRRDDRNTKKQAQGNPTAYENAGLRRMRCAEWILQPAVLGAMPEDEKKKLPDMVSEKSQQNFRRKVEAALKQTQVSEAVEPGVIDSSYKEWNDWAQHPDILAHFTKDEHKTVKGDMSQTEKTKFRQRVTTRTKSGTTRCVTDIEEIRGMKWTHWISNRWMGATCQSDEERKAMYKIPAKDEKKFKSEDVSTSDERSEDSSEGSSKGRYWNIDEQVRTGW